MGSHIKYGCDLENKMVANCVQVVMMHQASQLNLEVLPAREACCQNCCHNHL